MNARQYSLVWLSLGLLPLMTACGEDPGRHFDGAVTPKVGAETTAMSGYMEAEMFPLVPPNSDETLITLAPGTDLPALLAAYQLELLDQYPSADGLLIRVANPAGTNLDDLPSEDGVDAVSPNVEAVLGEVQTLILGFLEGGFDPETIAEQTWIGDLLLPRIHQTADGSGVLIAVLDTGAYFNHPLLANKMQSIPEERLLGSDEYMDHEDNDGDGEFDECFGHGSHVAGCILTVAPGATLLPIRVMTDDGVGSLWDILRGIELARDLGADIINLSLTLTEENDSMEEALNDCEAQGIVVVSAAGNSGNLEPKYPATSIHTFGVASVGAGNILSNFSGSGPRISLAAPGESIISSYPRTDLCSATGTSMATPITAGCIALVMDALSLSAQDATDRLCTHTIPISPSNGVAFGRVAPLRAISAGL